MSEFPCWSSAGRINGDAPRLSTTVVAVHVVEPCKYLPFPLRELNAKRHFPRQGLFLGVGWKGQGPDEEGTGVQSIGK